MLPVANSNVVRCITITAVYCISGNAEVGTRTKKRGKRIAGAIVLPHMSAKAEGEFEPLRRQNTYLSGVSKRLAPHEVGIKTK